MPVQASWDDAAKTIVRFDYSAKWTWEHVAAAMDDANALMHSVNHKVCIIHELSQSAGVPSGALTHAHRFTTGLPENWDISVVVGSGTFTETLLNIFSRVYKKLGERYKTAPTLDEARAVIAKHRAK